MLNAQILWIYQVFLSLALRVEGYLIRGVNLLIMKALIPAPRSGKIPRGQGMSEHNIKRLYTDDRGMSTVEYALGCVAAAALGALLYTVVTSDTVKQALTQIFEKALQQGG